MTCGAIVRLVCAAASAAVLGACSGSPSASRAVPQAQVVASSASAHALPLAIATAMPRTTSSWPIGASVVPANVGINVEGVVDYSVAQQFVDAMRQSRPWGSPGTPWDEAVSQGGQVDANGWPTVDAGIVVLCCVASDGSAADPGTNSLLGGAYALSFNGKANVSIVAGSGSVDGYTYDPKTDRSTATVTWTEAGSGGIDLAFTNTQRIASSPVGSGITDVRLTRPEYAPNGIAWWTNPGQKFTTPFLATLAGYSTLRFMDWTATNGSPVVNWSDRTRATYATQQHAIPYNGGHQPTGASWEDAIDLANATNEDMWINVPAMATDQYVTALAQELRGGLHSNLHVYVEYSNEVWNGSFPQFSYNLSLAESEAQSNPAYAADCDATNIYRWGQCRVAERLVQIANDFAKVDGRAALGTTIRPVFATQLGSTYYLSAALNFIAKTYGPPNTVIYGIAQAPYWTGDNSLDGLSEQQELQNAEANLQTTVPSTTAAFTAYAVAYGLHNFTYEGGPGMSGTQSLAAKVAANLDPAMGSQVTQALDDFFASGGDLMMYYDDTSAYGQYGMWGSTDDVFDRAAPKFEALAAARGTSQVRTVGSTVPGTIAGTNDQFEVTPGGYGQPSYFYYRNGEELAYLINAPAAGTYALTLTVGSYVNAPSQATIFVNGGTAGTLATPATGGNPTTTATTLPLTVALPQGLSIVDVAETSGEFALYSIGIAPPGASPARAKT